MIEIKKSKAKLWSRLGARATLGQAILEVAKERDDFYVMSADLAQSSGLVRFREEFPDRFINAVIAVNQTYVDSLKEQGQFNKEAQEIAFKRVFETVVTTLNEEAYNYLNETIGDLNNYITTLIEAAVKENKTEKIA